MPPDIGSPATRAACTHIPMEFSGPASPAINHSKCKKTADATGAATMCALTTIGSPEHAAAAVPNTSDVTQITMTVRQVHPNAATLPSLNIAHAAQAD